MQAQHDAPVSPLWPGERARPLRTEPRVLRLDLLPTTPAALRSSSAPFSNVAGTAREAVLSVLGRQGLRCLRSSCRAGRAAANARVTSVKVKRLAPLPPNLPNLRRVDFGSIYLLEEEEECYRFWNLPHARRRK
jgi:hypothetical protein